MSQPYPPQIGSPAPPSTVGSDLGHYGPPSGAYPPPQGPPPQHAGAYPPPEGSYPPPQGAYPPPQSAFPPLQGAYPPPPGSYPPPNTGPMYQGPNNAAPSKESNTTLFFGAVIGCGLAFFLSPLTAMCGLCCFQTTKSRGAVFLGAALGTLIWAVGAISGWGVVDALADREELREIGVDESGYYYFDGSRSIRCTEQRNGVFVFGPDDETCVFNTPGFRDALLTTETVLLVASIVFFVLFVLYLVAGIVLFRKNGKGKKREIEDLE